MNHSNLLNGTIRVPPRIGPRKLLGAWAVTLTLSVLYCWLYECAHGGVLPSLGLTIRWAIEVWSGWMLLSICFIPPLSSNATLRRVWSHRWGWVAVVVVAPVFAVASEWTAHLAISIASGGAVWKEPFWLLLYERAPWCLVAGAGLAMLSALSVERVTQPLHSQISGIRPLETPPPVNDTAPATLRIPTPTGPAVLSAAEIEAIIAAENYVEICTSDGKQYLHRATLQGMGEALRVPTMIRVRRSAIINLDHLRVRMPGGRLRLTSGRVVAIGRTYRADFEATLEMSKVGSPHPQQYS